MSAPRFVACRVCSGIVDRNLQLVAPFLTFNSAAESASVLDAYFADLADQEHPGWYLWIDHAAADEHRVIGIPIPDETLPDAAPVPRVTPAVVAKALPHVQAISARARVVAAEKGWTVEQAQAAIDKGWIR